MIISCILAKTKNDVIGKDNDMPWHISDDLKYFKKITSGHAILMGRKNFESIGRVLPNRTNIIITRNKDYKVPGAIVVHSIEEGLKYALENKEEEAFIIGGGQIYNQSADYWDKIYITQIDADIQGDVYFSDVNFEDWKLISQECHKKSEVNEYDFCFEVYERRV